MSLIDNKRGLFDFSILEEFEAGLELLGTETRALRGGQGSLRGARVVVRGGEAYLVGATIPPWQQANAPRTYDPERPRRLLLKEKEILRVAAAESEKGLTIVPISVYSKGRHLKLSVGIARGKKKADKRESIKKRDDERRVARTLRK